MAKLLFEIDHRAIKLHGTQEYRTHGRVIA